MFLRSNQNSTIDKEFVLDLAQEHLTLLHQKYDQYFFTISTEQYGWIRNPFLAIAKMLTQDLSFPVSYKMTNSEIKIQRCST